ncbi:MAG: D-glycero-beta-D-manno-heptose 1,7-bisphosphate 7-phosphatase [Gammaproteobacteria bacterium]|jgi:D-glycero-D-manno-heptose 1,7-bisphosphate phosphatase
MQLIILDRDGVINEDSDEYVKSPEEWIPIPGSLEAIAKLSQAGWCVVVATNQSGIARGLFGLETLHAMHQKMTRLLDQLGGRVEGVFFCPHGPEDDCDCRKPEPGLMNQIEQRLRTDLTDVPAVGDSLRDLQAAEAVGARPILVRTGKGERTLASGQVPDGTPVYDDLATYVQELLSEEA